MQRFALSHLKQWLSSSERKPLVVRGARQVGKTWLIRQFAKETGRKLIELNFERMPSHASFFVSNDPKQILQNLSVMLNEEIDPHQVLLFLDEIQANPILLSKLRWFAEEMPELPVVAAGSLLEFVLAEHSFSMPVGRISYLHLEPLSYEEFLIANDKAALFNYLSNYQMGNEIPIAIHEQFMQLFREYLLIGGLPAAVKSWISDHSLITINKIQNDLLSTYRDDFAKYNGRIAVEKLDEVMLAIPKMLGQKFVFSHVNPDVPLNTIKKILDLLSKARLCHRIWSVAANGVPLGAEIKEKVYKEIFLDVGLCCAILGLDLMHVNAASEMTLINNGGLAEQFVGQMLRTIQPYYIEPILYYWHREESNSNAEIDYVIQHGNKVIPIEVKAGKAGSLKSLHVFMGIKKLTRAIRINSDIPSITMVDIKDHAGDLVNYGLLSLPFYLVGQIHRLLTSTS